MRLGRLVWGETADFEMIFQNILEASKFPDNHNLKSLLHLCSITHKFKLMENIYLYKTLLK